MQSRIPLKIVDARTRGALVPAIVLRAECQSAGIGRVQLRSEV